VKALLACFVNKTLADVCCHHRSRGEVVQFSLDGYSWVSFNLTDAQ